MFIIARFILGLGIVFAIVAASSLIGGELQFISLTTCWSRSYVKSYHIPRNEQLWVRFSTLATWSVSRDSDHDTLREGIVLIPPRIYKWGWSHPRDVCYDEQLGVENPIFPPSSA